MDKPRINMGFKQDASCMTAICTVEMVKLQLEGINALYYRSVASYTLCTQDCPYCKSTFCL